MESKKGTDWVLLRRVLATAKPFKSLFLQSIFLAIAITPFSIAQPFIVQKIVDNNIIKGQQEGMITLSILFFIVLFINVLYNYLRQGGVKHSLFGFYKSCVILIP